LTARVVLDAELLDVASIDPVVTTDVPLEAVCFEPPEEHPATKMLKPTSAASDCDLVGGMCTVWFLSC
jgi:hypothetical protein